MSDTEKLDVLLRMLETLKDSRKEPASPVERMLVDAVGAIVEMEILKLRPF